MPYSAYVICATPRSGSTVLCDLLTSSGVAGQPNSYFRPEDIGYWANVWGVGEPETAADPVFNRAYLTAMIRAGTAQTGIFGLRLMWQSVNEAIERLSAALGSTADLHKLLEQELGSTLFIHLSRKDKVAQAVSLVRARKTGLWHIAADGSERERIAPARPPVFDARLIDQARTILKNDDESWVSFFDHCRIEPMHFVYEDLVAHPQKVIADILVSLDRDPSLAAMTSVQTAKIADDTSLDWIQMVQRDGYF